jgi:hypothetical protein
MVTLAVSGGACTVTVPEIANQPESVAQEILKTACDALSPCLLGVVEAEPSEVVGVGNVIRSDKPAGEEVLCGSEVKLYISLGSECELDSDGDRMNDCWEKDYGLDPYDSNDAEENPDNDCLTNIQEFQSRTDPRVMDQVTIPDVGGKDVREANDILNSSCLEVNDQLIRKEFSEVEEGKVIRSDPGYGTLVDPWERLVLVVSSGILFDGDGFITYRIREDGDTSIYLQRRTGEPVVLVSSKDDAEVLEYTANNGGLFAIWVRENQTENIYIMEDDGSLRSVLNEGWSEVAEADWTLDGRYLIVEAILNNQNTFFFFDNSGNLVNQLDF